MARKNSNKYKLLTAQSLSTGFVTDATVVETLDNCAYQVNVTTTDSAGSFTVEASLDYRENLVTNTVVNPGNWITLTLAGGTPAVAAANTFILIDLNQLPFEAIRLRYTPGTAGTGTCDVYIVSKQLGG